MTELWEITAAVVGGALAGVLAYAAHALVPALRIWLEERIGSEGVAAVERIVAVLVKSADQLFKDVDPDGTVRNRYVKQELEQLEIAVSGHVNAMIEAAVLDLKR